MRDQFRISGGRGCQRERRAESVRSRNPVPDRQGGSASLWRMAIMGIVVLLILGWGNDRAGAQSGQSEAPPPPPGMSFTTHLDHTAVWVGDQFHYTIVVDHSPNYEFVLDTVSRETVNMEPFQVMGLSTKTASLKNGNQRLYVDLTLADYTTGKTSEQIPQLTLFYFQRDKQTTGVREAAAESLTVSGPVVGLRTTLPPEPEDIRDAITVSGWDSSRWWLAGAGTFSLFVLVIGAGWETVRFMQRRKVRQGPDRRKAMEAVRDRWALSVPSDFSNTQAVIEFHERCYHDVKEYLGYYLETPALGLTSEEIEAEMQRLETDPGFAAKVVRTLGTLEEERYSRNGAAPSREAAERAAQEVREIFAFSVKQ